MASLSSVKKGRTAYVSGLSGGNNFLSRVYSMGFTLNTPVTVLQNMGQGPLLVYLRDTQIALGRSIACKIQVDGEEK